MLTERKYNYSDLITFFSVMILMGISVLVVYSASAMWAIVKFNQSDYMLTEHVLKVFIAIIALFIGMNIDYKKYKKITKWVLVCSIFLLITTLIINNVIKGAARSIEIAGVSLQPAEVAKFALIFHLCTMIDINKEKIQNSKDFYLKMLIWIGLVVILVMIPDYSTGAMIMLISIILLFIAGVRIKHLTLTCLSLLPFIFIYVLIKPYRLARIEPFVKNLSLLLSLDVSVIKNLESTHWIKNAGDQLLQGIIGFGNGGILGVGIGNSKQRDLFLTESYGDFIFSIVGEEYGLIGTLCFMLLFAIILWRGFKIAKFAQDDYGKFLAYGITTAIVMYALVNSAVTLGILPTTGLPMPFTSYGGSSFVVSAYVVGVLLNISRQTDLHPKISKVPIIGTVNSGKGKQIENHD